MFVFSIMFSAKYTFYDEFESQRDIMSLSGFVLKLFNGILYLINAYVFFLIDYKMLVHASFNIFRTISLFRDLSMP